MNINPFNEDGTIDREKLELAAMQSAIESDAEEMEKALELSAAGWEAQKPSPPAGDTFWHQQRVMSWKWRRPGKRGGRLFLSTNQAWRHLRREKGLPLS